MQTSTPLLSLFRATRGARRATALMLALTLGSLPFAGACTSVQHDNASSFLIVQTLSASSGADPSKFGGVLSSDVVACVKSSGAPGDAFCPAEFQATIFGDAGKVKLSLAMKDPALAPSAANFITVNRYHVDFARADGGTGVPASFDSAFTITVSGEAEVGFILIPVLAKESSPLVQLRSGGEIKTIATITFFGKDQAGRDVQATATIGVNFCDYGDPQ